MKVVVFFGGLANELDTKQIYVASQWRKPCLQLLILLQKVIYAGNCRCNMIFILNGPVYFTSMEQDKIQIPYFSSWTGAC